MKRDEHSFEEDIKKLLESQQIEVYTQVIPEECKYWEYPYQVDIIFYYFGEYYGFELKHISTFGQGGVIAKAFLQLEKYKNLTYFTNQKIKQWGIGLNVESENTNPECSPTTQIFVQTFFNFLGYNYLRYKEYSYNRKVITINPTTKDRKEIKNFKWVNNGI